MVAADPLFVVLMEELGILVPVVAFNPLTAVQTMMLGALTFAAVGF